MAARRSDTALCDEAMALALYTALENGERIATISESTSYLEGVRRGKIIAKRHSRKEREGCSFHGGLLRKQTGMKPSYRRLRHLSPS